MTRVPMFPLGTVLVPTAVLPLHIFEPRYRQLMEDLRDGEGDSPEGSSFGIVLIERGSEVGGGDVRVRIGTMARLLEAQRLDDGRWLVAAAGTRRIRVVDWLPDDPYPLAVVDEIDEVSAWEADADGLLAEAGRLVRRTLAMVSELGEGGVPLTFDLADDPLVAAWQLCALVPVGPHDRQGLLEIDDPVERLVRVVALADEVASTLAYRLGQEP